VAGLGLGALSILQAWLFSQVTGQVFLGGASLEQAAPFLELLLAVFVLRAGLSYLNEVSASALARRVKASLRQRLLAHLFALGPAYTQGEHSAELVNQALEGVEALDAYFSQYLPQLLQAALLPLIFLAVVFPLDWLSGLIMLCTAPLIPLFMTLIGRTSAALTRRQWLGLSRMNAYFLDVLQGLPTLKILGRSQEQTGVIARVSERYRQVTMSVLRVTFLSSLALELVATLSTAVIAVEVGLRLLYGQISFEQAFFILLLAPEFYQPLRLLGGRFHAGTAGAEAARGIFAILDQPLPLDASAGRSTDSRPEAPADSGAGIGITFENVSFSYPDSRPALQGVSFAIQPGQKVALVGPSGSGKSTLTSLLLRFIQPAQGNIWVEDGERRRLEDIPVPAWRARLAWLPQRPTIFHDTAAANLRLGSPQASQAQIEQAARQAQVDAFLASLPQGYETLLGESGRQLSGGQAQRLALARAALRQAPLLILDEPTAHLDPKITRRIQQALDELLPGRTAVIIAHHLATIQHSDLVIVLQAGRVAACGSPGEVLRDAHAAGLIAASLEPGSPAGMGSSSQIEAHPHKKWEVGASLRPAPVSSLHASDHGIHRPLPWLLELLRPYRGWVALSAGCGFAATASGIGLMATSAYIIAAAALHPSIAEIQAAVAGVRFFGIARGVFRYLERTTSHQATFHLLARLRQQFYQALEPLAPARLLRYPSGDLLGRITSDIHALENFYVRALAPPLIAALVLGAANLLLPVFTPGFSVTLALGFTLLFLAAGIGLPLLIQARSRPAAAAVVLQRARLSARLVEALQGLPELLAFNQGERWLGQLSALDGASLHAQSRLAAWNGLQAAAFSLLVGLGAWLALVLAIPWVSAGLISGVFLPVIVLVVMSSFEAAAPLPQAAQQMEVSLQSARRLLEVVKAAPEVPEPAVPATLPRPAASETPVTGKAQPAPGCSLEVCNLWFRYPPPLEAPAGTAWPGPAVLQGLSFRLPPGGSLALSGPSGGGKTTLVSLLLRFWDYQQGEILLNGIDLRRLPGAEVRRMFSVLSQNPYIFSASLRQNLLLARPNASDAEMLQALDQVRLLDLVQGLPAGLDTWAGEQGVKLSGGERQRLAAARLLLQDAPILVLDEPTASLDMPTARQVFAALRAHAAGRSLLLISHRPEEVKTVDQVIRVASSEGRSGLERKEKL
jgi:ATP-binding cassette subfamily C protein CydCD